jgi:hypothetical protein
LNEVDEGLIAERFIEIIGDPGGEAFARQTAIGVTRDHDHRGIAM